MRPVASAAGRAPAAFGDTAGASLLPGGGLWVGVPAFGRRRELLRNCMPTHPRLVDKKVDLCAVDWQMRVCQIICNDQLR